MKNLCLKNTANFYCMRKYKDILFLLKPLYFPVSASWQSGDVAACKAVYTGSIPVLASTGPGGGIW